MKHYLYLLSIIVIFFACNKEDLTNTSLSTPTNIEVWQSTNYICISWGYVTNADFYEILGGVDYNNLNTLGTVYATSQQYYQHDMKQVTSTTTMYFRVRAVKNLPSTGSIHSESEIISFTYVPNNSGNGGGNTGNNDDDNNNNNDDDDDNTGGGTNNKPSAPTSIKVDNYGSITYPDIRITWGAVTGAIGYKIYRSTSSSGSYSLRGTTANTYYSDSGCKIGNTYYYKIKAYNNAGESDYSNYVEFNFKDTRKPGPVKYGNCSVSGTTMTIRWTVPTDASYGKPTKALLRVKNPYSTEYATIQELSGSATSASFSYLPWVDSSGYVYVGIILENENGTGGGSPKVYDNNNKRWIN